MILMPITIFLSDQLRNYSIKKNLMREEIINQFDNNKIKKLNEIIYK